MKKTLAIILTLAMALSLVTVSYAADEESNLVAYWSFDKINDTDGVLTIEDLSGKGNTLTINDTNYDLITGFRGKAINFNTTTTYDGSKQATADINKMTSYLNGVSGITSSMWVKRENIGSSSKNSIISFSPNGAVMKISAQRFGFINESRSATKGEGVSSAGFYPISSAVASSSDFYPVIGSVNGPNAHAWIHVAAVNDYATGTMRVYLDGELIDEIEAANWTTDVTDLTVNATAGYFGVGESLSIIDEVKVYNKALTQDEIKESISPVLEYNFETMMENTTYNATGVSAPVTLTDSATVVEGAVGNAIHTGGKNSLILKTFLNTLLNAEVISLSTWVKSVDGVLTTKDQSIIQEGFGGFNIALAKDGRVRGGCRTLAGDPYTSISSADPIFTAGDTSWHHVAVTFNYPERKLTLFVDGKLNNEVICEEGTFQRARYEFKGHQAIHYDYFSLCDTADVVIDETKIYRRALTASEVAAEYNDVFKMVNTTFDSSSDSVTVSCDIMNTTGADIAANGITLFLGMYDDDRLVKVSSVGLPAVANGGTLKDQTITLSDLEEPEIYEFKLFVWNGTSLAPYYTENFIIE